MDVKKININQSEQTYNIASDIYDVTTNNNGATFESLQSLLNSDNLSTLIPTAVRCGGMTIRFIQTSDNKYVQYRLMTTSFSTIENDWEDTAIIGTDRIAEKAIEFSKIGDDTINYMNDAFNNSNLLEVKDYIDEKTFDISSLDSYSRLTIPIGKLNGKFNIDVFIESSQPFTTDDASLTLYYNINVVGGYHTIVNKKFDVNENVCKVSIKASEFKDVDIDSADITSSKIIIQCVNKNGIERNFTIEKILLSGDAAYTIIHKRTIDTETNIKKSTGLVFTDNETVNKFIKDIFINPTKVSKKDLVFYVIRRNFNGTWLIILRSKSDNDYRITASASIENSSMPFTINDEIVGFIEINWEYIDDQAQTIFNIDLNSNIYIERYDIFNAKETRELCEANKNNISNLHAEVNNTKYSLVDMEDECFVSYELGYALRSDGGVSYVVAQEPQFATTDKIAVIEGDKIYFTGGYTITEVFSPIVGYDINDNATVLLGWEQRTFQNKEVIIPSNILYIRASANLKVSAASLILKRESIITKRINNIITSKEIKYNDINIYADGSGDFDTITNAVNSISDSNYYNRYNILIHEGIYDFISDYFGDRDYSDVADKGLLLPDYVNLIGIGRQKNIIINCNFPETIKYSTSYHFSPINLRGWNNDISNLTISVFNCRYCIHDQVSVVSDVNNNYTHTFRHLTLIHNGFDESATGMTVTPNEENNTVFNRWSSVIPLGQGTCGKANIIIEDVDFCSINTKGCSFLTHDAKEDFAEIGTRITMENCRLKSAQDKVIQISSLGDKHDNYFTIKNCILLANSPKIVCLISSVGYNNNFIYQLRGNLQQNVIVELGEEYKDFNWILQ